MARMTIALGINDTPNPGNEELPHYFAIRRGLEKEWVERQASGTTEYDTSAGPKVFLTIYDPNESLFILRTEEKDIYLKLGLISFDLKYAMCLMFDYALSRADTDELMLTRRRQRNIFVRKKQIVSDVKIFVMSPGH